VINNAERLRARKIWRRACEKLKGLLRTHSGAKLFDILGSMFKVRKAQAFGKMSLYFQLEKREKIEKNLLKLIQLVEKPRPKAGAR
jgi:hypothetical protein